MENKFKSNIPPSTNWSKILLITLFGLIIVAGLVFAGIQIVKQPTIAESTPTPTASTIEPVKIVEDVRDYMNIAKSIQVANTTFEWRDETNVNGRLQCSDQPVSVSGRGFTASNVKTFQNPDLTKLDYANAKISICNVAAGTIISQTGYIIGNIVCVFKTESTTVDERPTISFSCGVK